MDDGYAQFLGLLDPLGMLNSWGHPPQKRPLTHHGTNSLFPFSMPVPELVEDSV